MSTIFCDIMPCSTLKGNQHFRGTYRLHLQGHWINWARNLCESRWQAEFIKFNFDYVINTFTYFEEISMITDASTVGICFSKCCWVVFFLQWNNSLQNFFTFSPATSLQLLVWHFTLWIPLVIVNLWDFLTAEKEAITFHIHRIVPDEHKLENKHSVKLYANDKVFLQGTIKACKKKVKWMSTDLLWPFILFVSGLMSKLL
jgi:hypothetical protein